MTADSGQARGSARLQNKMELRRKNLQFSKQHMIEVLYLMVWASLQQPGATFETGQMSSVETRQMPQQQSSILSQQQTSVLPQQKTSTLFQQKT